MASLVLLAQYQFFSGDFGQLLAKIIVTIHDISVEQTTVDHGTVKSLDTTTFLILLCCGNGPPVDLVRVDYLRLLEVFLTGNSV